MIQQTVTQQISLSSRPAALIWLIPPATPVLRLDRRGFGFACDEDDLAQALAAHLDAVRPVEPAPQVDPADFERLYNWFLA